MNPKTAQLPAPVFAAVSVVRTHCGQPFFETLPIPIDYGLLRLMGEDEDIRKNDIRHLQFTS